MDYGALKKAIKRMKDSLTLENVDHLPQQKKLFFQQLSRDLERVNTFVMKHLFDISTDLQEIQLRTTELKSGELTGEAAEDEKVRLQRLLEQNISSITLLKQFCYSNKEGFRKIVKKFCKHLSHSARSKRFQDHERRLQYRDPTLFNAVDRRVQELSKQLDRLSIPSEGDFEDDCDPFRDYNTTFVIRSDRTVPEILEDYKQHLELRTFSHFGYPYNLYVSLRNNSNSAQKF